jgi:Fe-S-cluster-containing dehydrogenase component
MPRTKFLRSRARRETRGPDTTRRGLLKAGLVAPALVAAPPRSLPGAAAAQALAPLPQAPEGPILRMMQDLRRALKKPVEQRRWTMVIDLRKCIGCSACTVACIAENRLPPGVVYRPVVEEEVGTYPNVTRRFLPRPCMQCDNPPCVPVCPVAATYKRPDGVVEINYDKCIGCRYCISACPYGARYFDWGEYWTDGTPSREPYEEEPSHEYGREWRRRGTGSPVGNVRKCQFCLHRLEAGMLPACVTTCVGGATYFGDASDPESLVSELASSERAFRLKEELGTRPKVVYLR